MKHLIKQYYHFFGEIIRPEKVFYFSLNCFYHSNDLTHFRLFSEFPYSPKKPTETLFLLAFFCPKHLKSRY
jgi:hypothetical protein